jgi:hypothetical protein
MRCWLWGFFGIEGLDMRICWGSEGGNFAQRDTGAMNGARAW